MSARKGTGVRIYFCRNSVENGQVPAGLARIETREYVAIEAVPCSGKIDPRYILKAFESGTDSVYVIACPAGECKMMEGNLRALRRGHAVRELLEEAGISPDAVHVFVPNGKSINELADTIADEVESGQFVNQQQGAA
jgi:F420-non-reducing hydrogenase iron-sulfur subunit